MSEEHIERLWRDLCEKDDRTSLPEYPDMALITYEEFRAAILEAPAAPVAPGDEDIVEAQADRLCGIGCGCDEQMAEHCEFSNGYDRCVRQQRAIEAPLAAARPLLARQSNRRTDAEVEAEIERVSKLPQSQVSGWDVNSTQARIAALRWTLNKLEPGR